MKKILFHDNQLNLRGTSVSLYNYAKYNEEILGNKSVITTFPNSDISGFDKFTKRFETHIMPFHEYEQFCLKQKIDFLYLTKSGFNDGIFLNNIKSLIHCVFQHNEPHGHKYAYISNWLAKNQGYNSDNKSIPYIIEKLPQSNYKLREKLGIPKNKIVFGCYGGSEQFDITWVHEVIKRIVTERNDIVFLFMNINEFTEPHPNIIHLPGTWVLEEKSAFINACDAMIHARNQGETFGCSIAEFSLENKPVITYLLSSEKSHLDILSEKGIYYTNSDELYDILNNLKKYILFDDYFEKYIRYSPDNIISIFDKIFLK